MYGLRFGQRSTYDVHNEGYGVQCSFSVGVVVQDYLDKVLDVTISIDVCAKRNRYVNWFGRMK